MFSIVYDNLHKTGFIHLNTISPKLEQFKKQSLRILFLSGQGQREQILGSIISRGIS